MIHTDIKSQIKDAMLKKEAVRLTVLRGLSAAFTNELVAQKRPPQEILSDEDCLKVIERAVKQRKDSIEQFTKGNRADLADSEKAELAVLETFLPEMMSIQDIESFVTKKKAELNVTDKSKMGMFMGTIMKELKGKARGEDVKSVIDSLFQ